MSEFPHFHCHNEYSLLDGYGSAEQFTKEAARLGMKTVGITNHANVDGAVKFESACKEANITPMYGCEFYIVGDHTVKEKGDKRYHIVALAKNLVGWNNILKMLTIANLE